MIFTVKFSGRYLPSKRLSQPSAKTISMGRFYNLNGNNSSPVVDVLLGHEVPFILVSGYSGHKGDPPVLKRAPRVRKPINFDELADRVTEVFVRRPLEIAAQVSTQQQRPRSQASGGPLRAPSRGRGERGPGLAVSGF